MSVFTWEHLRDVHDSLKCESSKCDSIKKEAFFRTCLNRCYYMALNISERTAQQKFLAEYLAHKSSFQGGTHELIIQFFANRAEGESKNVANALRRMKKGRTESDYHELITQFNPESQVLVQEKYLQSVLENLSKL